LAVGTQTIDKVGTCLGPQVRGLHRQ